MTQSEISRLFGLALENAEYFERRALDTHLNPNASHEGKMKSLKNAKEAWDLATWVGSQCDDAVPNGGEEE